MIRKVLVLPDIHYPYEDKKTMKAVEKYMASQKWDELIYLGDVLDFDCISSHNKHKPGLTANKSVKHDYDYVNKKFQLHRSIVGFNCKITFIEGNHDQRVERYIEEFPQLKGSLEVAKGLELEKKKINWVRYWSKGTPYKIGKATFIHGRYTNDTHSKKHVQAYGTSTFYGHLHDRQLYSLTRNGDNKTIIGESLGCLCDYRQYWTKGYPNRWQQAFGTFYFFENGHFTHYVTSIFDHKFVGPDGQVYDGNK